MATAPARTPEVNKPALPDVVKDVNLDAQKPDLQTELERRLRFKALLTEIFARFVNLSADQVDREIEDAQRAISECLGLEGSSLWQISTDNPDLFTMTYTLRNSDLPPVPKLVGRESFPWVLSKIMAKEIVSIPNMTAAPPEATKDMESLRQLGVKSTLVIPFSAGGGPGIGAIAFHATREEQDWPETLQRRLQLVGQVFASALDRKRSEQKLRDREECLSMAAACVGAGLWTLDTSTGHMSATERALELFGISPNEEVNLETFLRLVHPEDREVFRQTIEEATHSRRETSAHYRIVRPGREERWITSWARPDTGRRGEPARLMGVFLDITESKHLEQENRALRERLQAESDFLQEEIKVFSRHNEIIGQSKALRKVLQEVERVAGTDAVVLITGETGTGKELIARAIHNRSRRKDRLMVKVDCAALPASLIESELFGREKGAYTGAMIKQIGRFEMANGSSLFFDEIGEMSLDLQAKLLRLFQEGDFERLGSPRTIHVDVRGIAATHRDLAGRVKNGTFREDLYYRLNVFPIHVPSLRERPEDIPLLAWTFINEFNRKMDKKIASIAKETMEALQRYSWPGNIRELRNVIEHAVISSSGERLKLHMPKTFTMPFGTLAEAECRHIVSVLERTEWRIRGPYGAAQFLGMKPSTLYTTMHRLGIPTQRQRVGMPT
jgi:formate hydrogenlyase transcriptional activator